MDGQGRGTARDKMGLGGKGDKESRPLDRLDHSARNRERDNKVRCTKFTLHSLLLVCAEQFVRACLLHVRRKGTKRVRVFTCAHILAYVCSRLRSRSPIFFSR